MGFTEDPGQVNVLSPWEQRKIVQVAKTGGLCRIPGCVSAGVGFPPVSVEENKRLETVGGQGDISHAWSRDSCVLEPLKMG